MGKKQGHAGVFLHLSDIHFQLPKNLPEIDQHIRGELLKDLSLCRDQFEKVDAVLISGDIAYSGKREEYDRVEEWINNILSLCNCSRENVVIVPGNHDIDRGESGKFTAAELHKKIRKAKRYQDLDSLFEESYNDPGIKTLLDPMAAFNKFAGPYGCDVGSKNLKVVKRIDLGSGLKVVFSGFNSCLVSNWLDGKKSNGKINKLILTTHQLNESWDDTCVYFSLCHHPPNWLMFPEYVDEKLDARFSVQLFGHEHVRRIIRRGDKVLRIHAGAVQPERDNPGWKPSYNLIFLNRGKGTSKHETLELTVHGRIWNFESDSFSEDQGLVGNNFFKLLLNKRKGLRSVRGAAKATQSVIAQATEQEKMAQEIQKKITAQLYYEFLKLDFTERISILSELGVLDNSDEFLDDLETCKKAMKRIVEKKLVLQFSKVVVAKRGGS